MWPSFRVYLHYLDRELTEALAARIHNDGLISTTRTIVLATDAHLYCGISALYENATLTQSALTEFEQMLRVGELQAISHQRTRSEFLEARQTLYIHDARRYPNYFTAASEALRGITPTIEKPGGTTARLVSNMFDWSNQHTAESHAFAAGPLAVAPYITEALRRRENEAITYAYFRDHLGPLADRRAAEFTVRRKISEQFTMDYLHTFNADLATGVEGGLNRFDHLARFFPLVDIPLLGLLLYLSGLGSLTDPIATRPERWFDHLNQRKSIEHSIFSGTLQCLLKAMADSATAAAGPVLIDESSSVRQASLRDRMRSSVMIAARAFGKQEIDVAHEHPVRALELGHTYISGLATRIERVMPSFAASYDTARSQLMPETVDVLLATAVEIEEEVLEQELAAAGLGSGRRQFGKTGVNSYYLYGPIGGATVATIRSSMGSGGAGGSHQAVADAIHDLRPASVISLGIAFGIEPKKTRLGTLLISNQLFDYEAQRAGSEGGSIKLIPRGPKQEASPRLLDRFRRSRLRNLDIAVGEGLILSGSKLIDNVDYRDSLLALAPEAIGGEMEGAGVSAAAVRRNVDWIVAKAVCDYADGRKRVHKAERQKMAARNSARAVIHVLRGGGLHTRL